MKHFINKIFFFLLPFLILPIPLDIGISHFLRQNSTEFAGEFTVWNDIYNSNINCDIAIYGSSRAWVHINPQILENKLGMTAYNFGMDGHNFWLQYLRHLEYLRHNKKPKQIIVSVDIFSLQKRKNLFNYTQFLPYMLWNTNIYKYTHSYEGFKTIDYFVPLIRYFGKTNALNSTINVITYKNKQREPLRNNGFAGMDKEWNSDLEKAKNDRKQYKVNLNKESIALFNTFIIETKKMGIEIFLVYTPEYIEGQKFVSNRDEVIKLYKNFSNKYIIPFLDYSDDDICYDRELFYNASHLNKRGAELFTKKLANDLLKHERTTKLYTPAVASTAY